MSSTAIPEQRTFPWRLIFRLIRWSTYAAALITLLLVLRKAPPPVVETSPQAAARAEQKFEQAQLAVSSGQPATIRMDQTELNSYLISHLEIPSNPAASAPVATSGNSPSHSTPSTPNSGATTASPDAATSPMPTPSETPLEQVEQMRSAVKDVKVELIEDRARAFVVFDLHGKDMTLQLEGRLGAENGYLRFEPVAGQLGSLPIPRSALESAVQRLMESPENREKLRLPDGMSSLKIENGEIVATYQ